MTPKPKTITVKAVGVLRPNGKLTQLNTYGENGNYKHKSDARFMMGSYVSYWKGSKIVNCLITVQLKKGKK